MSSGVLFYLYFANVAVPIVGTEIELAPGSHALRGSIHALLFLLCAGSLIVRRQRAAKTMDGLELSEIGKRAL